MLAEPRPTRGAFEMLEPCEGRLSCTVLRGGSGVTAASLPDSRRKFEVGVVVEVVSHSEIRCKPAGRVKPDR